MSNLKFKKTGRLLKDLEKSRRKIEVNEKSRAKPFGIILPLSRPSKKRDTLFSMSYSINEQISSNLKNLIMTTKGEVLCNPEFGTNLKSLYNRTDVESIEEIAMEEIKSTASRFMPFVTLTNFSSKKIPSTINESEYHLVTLDFYVEDPNEIQSLEIKINTSR